MGNFTSEIILSYTELSETPLLDVLVDVVFALLDFVLALAPAAVVVTAVVGAAFVEAVAAVCFPLHAESASKAERLTITFETIFFFILILLVIFSSEFFSRCFFQGFIPEFVCCFHQVHICSVGNLRAVFQLKKHVSVCISEF